MPVIPLPVSARPTAAQLHHARVIVTDPAFAARPLILKLAWATLRSEQRRKSRDRPFSRPWPLLRNDPQHDGDAA